MSDAAGMASPANHWKRRPKTVPIPRDQAARQGEITRLAFLLLGRERAIAFLNTDHPALGGRPLALATATPAGHASVEAELGRMTCRAPRADEQDRRGLARPPVAAHPE